MKNGGHKPSIEDARRFIRAADPRGMDAVVMLGSGLGAVADEASDPVALEFGEIPGFAQSTVAGHGGRLVIGGVGGRTCALMQGRLHLYEGYTPGEVAFPVRVLLGLGRRLLIVTNAAGAVNASLGAGDLMLIADHINLTGTSPLAGPNDESLGPRFPDMGAAYSARLSEIAGDCAGELGMALKKGVYAGVLGPAYETPAEVGMLRSMGADAVGMSTVTEVIAARHMGAEVLGISCISNAAGGHGPARLSHDEVQRRAEEAAGDLARLLRGILERCGR